MDKLKKMPDNDKKVFSIIAAFILTGIIAVSWFAFGPKKNNNGFDVSAILRDTQINTLQNSVQQSIDQFSTMKNELFASATNAEIPDSTTSTSSIDTVGTTSTTTNLNNQN